MPPEPPASGRRPPPSCSEPSAHHFCLNTISDFPPIQTQSQIPNPRPMNPNFAGERSAQFQPNSSMSMFNPTKNNIAVPHSTLDGNNQGSNHTSIPPNSPRSKQTSFASLLSSPKEPILPLRPSYMYKGRPTICYTGAEIDSVCQQYQFALVGKFSQARPRLEAIRKEFSSMAFRGGCTVGLLKPGYIFIHLTVEEDMTNLYLKKSMFIAGAPMRIFRWSRHFRFESEPPFAAVWINIPIPPVWSFVPSILHDVANMIGKPLRVDQSTYKKNRWNMARICVELDLTKELVHDCCIRVDDDEFVIDIYYDHVPEYCKICEHVGHGENTCFVNPKSSWYRPDHKPKPNAAVSVAKPNVAAIESDNVVQLGPKTVPKLAAKKSDANNMAWIPVVSKNHGKEIKNGKGQSLRSIPINESANDQSRNNRFDSLSTKNDVETSLADLKVADRASNPKLASVVDTVNTCAPLSDANPLTNVDAHVKYSAVIANSASESKTINEFGDIDGTKSDKLKKQVAEVDIQKICVHTKKDKSRDLVMGIQCSINRFNAFLSSLDEKKNSKNVEKNHNEKNLDNVFEDALVNVEANVQTIHEKHEGQITTDEKKEENEVDRDGDVKNVNASEDTANVVASTPKCEDIIYISNMQGGFSYITTRGKRKKKRSPN